MEDLLSALIGALLEIFGEAILEIVSALVASFLVRLLRPLFRTFSLSGPWEAALISAVLGTCLGVLSMAVFPHPIVHPSRLHGLSLILSPLLTGLAMSQIGNAIQKRRRKTVQIESFAYGFLFALAVAAVRFWGTR